MLDLHPQLLAEGVDAAEPLPHAGKEHHVPSAAHQKVPVQPPVLLPALMDHGVHIGQQAIHVVIPAKAVGLLPELGRGIPQLRDEGVILHVRGTQGLVKIVQQGDDGAGHSVTPLMGWIADSKQGRLTGAAPRYLVFAVIVAPELQVV